MTLLLFPELSVSLSSYRALHGYFKPAPLNDLVKENCYADLKGQSCSLPPRDLSLPEFKDSFQLLACRRVTVNLPWGQSVEPSARGHSV